MCKSLLSRLGSRGPSPPGSLRRASWEQSGRQLSELFCLGASDSEGSWVGLEGEGCVAGPALPLCWMLMCHVQSGSEEASRAVTQQCVTTGEKARAGPRRRASCCGRVPPSSQRREMLQGPLFSACDASQGRTGAGA